MPQNIAGNSFYISLKTLIERTKTHSNELANENNMSIKIYLYSSR